MGMMVIVEVLVATEVAVAMEEVGGATVEVTAEERGPTVASRFRRDLFSIEQQVTGLAATAVASPMINILYRMKPLPIQVPLSGANILMKRVHCKISLISGLAQRKGCSS